MVGVARKVVLRKVKVRPGRQQVCRLEGIFQEGPVSLLSSLTKMVVEEGLLKCRVSGVSFSLCS